MILCADVEWLLKEGGLYGWSKEVSAEFSLSGDGSILFYGLEDGTIRALDTATLATEPPSTPPTPVPTVSPSTAPTRVPSPSSPTSSTASPATSAPVDAPTNAPGSYAAHINVLSAIIVGFAAIAALA
jgi:cell division septation protein DedD